MKLFQWFPVLFPASSHVLSRKCPSSRCSGLPLLTHIDVLPKLIDTMKQLGTWGTLGTGLKRHDIAADQAGNRTGNCRNELAEDVDEAAQINCATGKWVPYLCCSETAKCPSNYRSDDYSDQQR